MIELTQTFRAEPDQDRYRGGCTLLFDLNDRRLNYLVRKRLLSPWSVENQAKVQLAAMAAAAEQGQVYYPPGDPAGQRKGVRDDAPMREAVMTSASKRLAARRRPGTPRPRKIAGRKRSARKPHAVRRAVEGLSARAHRPNGARARPVRVYRQGLGDCILVRVKRASGDDFKLLIDCGVVLGTPDAGEIMTRVMENSGRATRSGEGRRARHNP